MTLFHLKEKKMVLTISQVKFWLSQSQQAFCQGPGFQTIISLQRLTRSSIGFISGSDFNSEEGAFFLGNHKSNCSTEWIYRTHKITIVIAKDITITLFFTLTDKYTIAEPLCHSFQKQQSAEAWRTSESLILKKKGMIPKITSTAKTS